jgi:ubiquinone/menaquinone biosynthesis C-methylase UbiE
MFAGKTMLLRLNVRDDIPPISLSMSVETAGLFMSGGVGIPNVLRQPRLGEIYTTRAVSDRGSSVAYTARIPAVISRLTFVAETICTSLGLKDFRLCGIGAGEGVFLDIIQQIDPTIKSLAVEPSANNCKVMKERGIDCFDGTIEEFMVANSSQAGEFDVVTLLWTLENCFSCRDMVEAASRLLKPGGRLIVAIGSRILVPFKKPLNCYLSKDPVDIQSFRFSANSLKRLATTCGFHPDYENQYIDNDVLCLGFTKKEHSREESKSLADDYRQVLGFFECWDKETQLYFSGH